MGRKTLTQSVFSQQLERTEYCTVCRRSAATLVTVIKSHSMLTSLVVVDLTLSLCGLIFISMVTSRSLAVLKDVISSGLAVMLGRRHAGSRPSIPSCTRHKVTAGHTSVIINCTSGAFHIYNRFVEKIVKNTEN